jgi:Nif-specific regulatory protein
MSLQSDSEQLAHRLADQPRHERSEAPVLPRRSAAALVAIQDQDVASRSPARLLITAPTQQAVETLARRIHASGPRARFPFVQTGAADLPVAADVLQQYCASVLAAAAGGSMLISSVEETPPLVQDVLLDLLDRLQFAGHPAADVRLISGTTVSLLDRVTAGTFPARLFYRLNIIHLMQEDRPHGAATSIDAR